MRISALQLPRGYRVEIRVPATHVPPELPAAEAGRWVEIRVFFGDTVIWDEAGAAELLDRPDDSTAEHLMDGVRQHQRALRLVP